MKIQLAKGLLMVLATILLTACASLGLAPAQNIEQRIAYGFSQNAALRSAAATAAENGRLGKQEAMAVLEITDQARVLLNAAKSAATFGDINTAEARLSLAVSILAALQNRLNDKSREAP